MEYTNGRYSVHEIEMALSHVLTAEEKRAVARLYEVSPSSAIDLMSDVIDQYVSIETAITFAVRTLDALLSVQY